MSVKSRLGRLRQELAAKGLSGFLVSQPENRYYLSGFSGSSGFLLITPGRAVLATDFRYLEQAGRQAPDYEVFPIAGSTLDWFPRLVAEPGLEKLGFESGHITLARYQRLTEALGKAKSRPDLVPVEGLVESLRMVKEAEEVRLIAEAAAIADSALEHIRDTVRAGMTEVEVAWEIEKFMREQGSQPVPFAVIVGAGPNSALPHAQPAGYAIRPGEPIVIDIGARVGGYGSDLTRTICLGAPGDTLRKVYDTVLKAQLAAIAGIKGGMTGGEADSLARQVIEQAGYGEAFGHALGHGVGLAVHEGPRLGPNSAEPLLDGMVFSVEPGIYISGWGGVRIEDTVVLESGKIRVMTKARK